MHMKRKIELVFEIFEIKDFTFGNIIKNKTFLAGTVTFNAFLSVTSSIGEW